MKRSEVMLTGSLSSDLSLLDFMLWGHLKDRVNKSKLAAIQQLKAAIRQEMEKFSFAMVDRMIEHLQHDRLPPVIQRYSAQLGHLL